MSNTQSRPRTNSQDEFGNGIWRLWPFSVVSRSLQKNQQSLEMRLLQLNEQQESLAIREEALSTALRKFEQISLQHQQNNTVEIDRLGQEIESLANRIVDALSALQRSHANKAENPKKLPSPQNPIHIVKGVANELAGETLPSLADDDLVAAQTLAENLKRLSKRERNIALQLKQLSDAAH